MKLRFTWNEDSQCWNVRARRKSTGKWETIGICHPAAKDAIKAGKTELIQWNVIPLIVVGRMTRTEAGETRTAQVHQ